MKSMPIDRDFPRKLRVMGIHRHADGKQHHLVWGPGKNDGENGRNDYTYKPDPIRENDCNCCMACIAACPTQTIEVYQDNIEYHNKASDTFLNADYS